MAMPPREKGGFFDGPTGQLMNKQDVVVVHLPGQTEESQTTLLAGVQDTSVYFEVTSPVYKGDQIIAPDPRGGTRTLAVTHIKMFDQRGNPALANLSYLLAKVEDASDVSGREPDAATHQVFNGPVINVHGGRANVAWGHGTINESSGPSEVSPGFERLAIRLAEAIETLHAAEGLDGQDREVGQEAANQALQEITKEAPDRKALRSFLVTVRGVLSGALGSAIGGGLKDLISSLIV